ncbi:MAG TPA: GIY-YIG nuclease family protein [Terracidiphilus sp.]|nr:GIY-YIG nuclease family protein [Terracidiphilus sp.]
MPFSGTAFKFDDATLDTVNEVAGVYGLFQQTAPNYFECLYVGMSDNLRRRLREHYNNPPAKGITHFFAEVHQNLILRAAREKQLISEFNPPGNTVGTR